jgi:hypothetical protein
MEQLQEDWRTLLKLEPGDTAFGKERQEGLH